MGWRHVLEVGLGCRQSSSTQLKCERFLMLNYTVYHLGHKYYKGITFPSYFMDLEILVMLAELW